MCLIPFYNLIIKLCTKLNIKGIILKNGDKHLINSSFYKFQNKPKTFVILSLQYYYNVRIYSYYYIL